MFRLTYRVLSEERECVHFRCGGFCLPLTPSNPETNPTLGWVKTSRQRYDQLVAAILVSVKHHFGADIHITGNGQIDREWRHGARPWETVSALELYQYVFPDRPLPAVLG